jgi:hypothetical protein
VIGRSFRTKCPARRHIETDNSARYRGALLSARYLKTLPAMKLFRSEMVLFRAASKSRGGSLARSSIEHLSALKMGYGARAVQNNMIS